MMHFMTERWSLLGVGIDVVVAVVVDRDEHEE